MKHSFAIRHLTGLLLIAILLMGLAARMYKISNPILDWHAFRQADTASVTRYYVQHGIDILHPKYDDISSIPSGIPNPEGYRMVEFPIVNALLASVLRISPILDLTLISRFASVLISLCTICLLFLLVRSISGDRTALMTSLVMALLPYNVYYSRVILPEPYLVFFIVCAVTSWWFYVKNRSWWLLLATIASLSLALLLKPFAIFAYPALIAIAWLGWQQKSIYQWSLWVVLVLPLLPFFAWRKWIEQYPQGIPANAWLLNGNDIRLKPAWFRWLFFERLLRLITSMVGSIFLISSVFDLSKKEVLVYGSWWLGMIAYLIIFATGNVQHDYYQAMLAPIVAITMGRGIVKVFDLIRLGANIRQKWVLLVGIALVILYSATLVVGLQPSAFYPERLLIDWLLNGGVLIAFGIWLFVVGSKPKSTLTAGIITGVLAFFSLVMSTWYVKEYYNVNHWEYLHIGEVLSQTLPANAKVIAPANGDTMFLFQLNRPGWPLGFDVSGKIAEGATHYVSVNDDDETHQLSAKYRIVEKNKMYTLIDLTSPLDATRGGEAQP